MLIDCSSHPEFDGHEAIHSFKDPTSGLHALVAIHRFGPLAIAGGGCRMRPFPGEQEALRDVLRLSRAMSYKLALAGVPAGGAKCVIMGNPERDKSEALLHAMGRAVHSLEGRFVIGADVGIDGSDLEVMAQETPYVERGSYGRDTISEGTAFGVRWAIRKAAQKRLNAPDLRGIHVGIQGLGKVGGRLAELLCEDGARLSISDLDTQRVATLARRLGATPIPPEQILAHEVDVLAPCALGDVLSEASVEKLRCRIVAGAANNQLENDEVAQRLHERGIVYVPDFLANMGAALAGAKPHACVSASATNDLTQAVAVVLEEVLQDAENLGVAPQWAAIARTQRLLAERGESRQKLHEKLAIAAFQRLWRSPTFAEQALRGRSKFEELRSRLARSTA